MYLMVMPSKVISCWRRLRQPCRGLMRLRLRSCAGANAGKQILACQFHARAAQPPNRRLQLTPLRVERDQGDFEIQIRLDRISDLSVRRN